LYSPSQKQWYKIATLTQKKVNFGWVMEKLALPLVIGSVVLAIGIIILRYYVLSFNFQLAIIVSSLIVLALCIFGFYRAKRYFESKAESLVRLESYSNLHSSLTAAEAGKTSWPKVPDEVDAGIKWNYPRLIFPVVGSLLLLTISFLIPVEAVAPKISSAAPRSWENLTSELNEMKEKDLVQEDYIKNLEEKLAELKEQPEKDWYSHQSLEATENLTKRYKRELKQLSSNIDKVEKSMNMLKEHSRDMTEAQRSKVLEQFNNAMESLEKGQMKPNKELMEQLEKINPEKLGALSAEDIQKLRESMRGMSEELKKQLREGLLPGEQLSDDNENLPGSGGGQGAEGEEGEYPNEGNPGSGSGGDREGGGHAPKILGDEAEKLTPGEIENLKKRDDKQSAPGDLLETTEGGRHDVDTSKTDQQEGGETDNTGAGGEAVWEGNYLPDEKRALKNFFK